ncbi:hypothetical protein [Melghirimyces algeriensis]|uniref:hypothetical protein n=1 Tax=Melghirimyces algeriensis TaxID=910412 RepID=UPI001159C3B7|nr:hypothetical protein [Melghirimyces algeriensis]
MIIIATLRDVYVDSFEIAPDGLPNDDDYEITVKYGVEGDGDHAHSGQYACSSVYLTWSGGSDTYKWRNLPHNGKTYGIQFKAGEFAYSTRTHFYTTDAATIN